MAEKTKRDKAEGRKNLLYILWIIALVVIMATAIIVVTTLSSHRENVLENSGNSDSADTGDTSDSSGPNTDDPDDDQGEKPGDDVPTVGKITFIMPVANATVLKEYTDNTIVFNKTLGVYTGHMGIDFTAPAGTEVVCVYDGVIESIVTSYLQGTTITVDHGGDLKTVYNSIEANEALYEGAKVSGGTVIGYVSDNNRQEYKDGPHLHFEVLKEGKKLDPTQYLIGDEK